jgi:RNA polymerase sigma-70 factor (ECF subfamily)
VPQDLSFNDLLKELRRQDANSAQRVFDRFQRRLIVLARDKLDSRVRQKLDPEDIIQSVFGTVFRRLAEGQFRLESWDSLWALLTCITVRKCDKWRDYYHAARRNIGAEITARVSEGESLTGWEFIDREPTPAEAATLAEMVQKLLHGLDNGEQEIAGLILQGLSPSEVCERVGSTQSKVYRVRRLVRDRLERWSREANA